MLIMLLSASRPSPAKLGKAPCNTAV